ncbi:MAG: sulfurtransferase [Bacteroidales bacterium]|nr:sulfurtransferase [Bacteroidales bacterium]
MPKYIYTILLVFTFIGNIASQDIITVSEMMRVINDEDYIIISCQTSEEYQKRHVQNSINLDHKDLYTNEPVRGLLKPVSEMAKILSDKGISSDKAIILYDEGTYRYASRVYWILDYLGVENIKILDGQMMALRRSEIPFTSVPTSVKKETFIAKVDQSKIVTIIQLKEKQENSNTVIIDARSADEYNGLSDSDMRKGHIPGAINIPYEEVLTGRRKLKSAEELKNLFHGKNICSDNEIIVYCESGVRATVLYFALVSALSYPDVKVYDGAYLEWQSDSENHVELSE